MKKTITLLAMAFTIGNAIAQTAVADFESFNLTANSYYKDTTSAPFSTNNATFRYHWTTGQYAYWSGGFSYTNKYDSITAGFGNLFGVRAYKGYNNSATYVIGQDGGVIKLSTPQSTVSGFYATNTTYAYKSMKSGDMFAKKFGGVSGNDPDYYGITMKGYLNGVLKSDTVAFYLADFRFANNTQDYILNTWEWVNTAALGQVDSIRFHFFSSDVGQFGINTPLFFGMDNFSTAFATFVGLASNRAPAELNVYPNPFNGALTIALNGNVTANATVLDITGKVIAGQQLTEAETSLNLEFLQPGIYFLELNSNGYKTTKKLVKN